MSTCCTKAPSPAYGPAGASIAEKYAAQRSHSVGLFSAQRAVRLPEEHRCEFGIARGKRITVETRKIGPTEILERLKVTKESSMCPRIHDKLPL